MLPRLFKKFRFTIPEAIRPTVVLYFSPKREAQIPQLNDLRGMVAQVVEGQDPSEASIPVVMYDNCWYEYGDGAYQMRVLEGELSSGPFRSKTMDPWQAELVEIRVYDPKDGLLDQFTIRPFDPQGGLAGLDPDLKRARSIIISEIFKTCCYLWLLNERPKMLSVDTQTRVGPAAFRKLGNTFKYQRMDDVRRLSAPTYTRPDEPSLIKKRDHQVIGHWRTYKSGVRVWVKPHRRGDPKLGTVTRIQT